MDPNLTHQSLKVAINQRNSSFVICGILMATCLVLSVCLLNKNEKTIIIPATLSRELEFVGSHMSTSYLEEMTHFFTNLLLDLTPQNIEYKSKQLLKYAEPASYHILEKYFAEESDKHKKYNLATSFTLLEIKVMPESLSAEVRGVLQAKFAEAGSEQQNVSYRIHYKNSGSKLLITKFMRL